MEWGNPYDFYLESLDNCLHYGIDLTNPTSLSDELEVFKIKLFLV